MALNNVTAVGSDQRWKYEVEKEIASLKAQVAVLKSQLESVKRK
jgi:hypothetical protein